MKKMMTLIFALLTLPALAGPLEVYASARFAAGVHNAAVVHQELLERVPGVATNLVERPTAADEATLTALVVGPLVATNVWAGTAAEDRAELVARRLDTRVINANNDRQSIDALVLAAKVKALEDRIARKNGDAYGPLSGQSQLPVVREIRGQVRWRALGLPRAPTLPEVRAAMKPVP